MSPESSILLHSCLSRTEVEATVKYSGRQGCVSVIVALLAVSTCGLSCAASSDFYYDNWQCNNYLSAESVVIQAIPGQLVELHIRDDIPVSMKYELSRDQGCICQILTRTSEFGPCTWYSVKWSSYQQLWLKSKTFLDLILKGQPLCACRCIFRPPTNTALLMTFCERLHVVVSKVLSEPRRHWTSLPNTSRSCDMANTGLCVLWCACLLSSLNEWMNESAMI